MGMYSFFDYEDIEVLDYENLKRVIKILRKDKDGKELSNFSVYAKKLELNDKDKSLSFSDWNELKIISYWYDEMSLLLDLISPYIEGNVYFNFETNDESGKVSFIDGKCIITTGVMEWNENTAEDFYSKDLKLNKEISKLKSKLKLVRTEKSI